MDRSEHFERNGRERIAVPWESAVEVAPEWRRGLGRSLQRFQLTLSRLVAPLPPPARRAARAAWLAFCRVTCAVFAWDHRGALRGMEVSAAEFRAQCEPLFERAAEGIFAVGLAAMPAAAHGGRGR